MTAMVEIRLLVTILLLQSFGGYPQKITKSGIDKFTGKNTIETDGVIIAEPAGLMMKLVTFKTVDTTIFIYLGGTYGGGNVDTTDATIFLFNDKTTFKIYPTRAQTTKVIMGAEAYGHEYYISKAQMEILAKNNPIAIRQGISHSYVDMDIKSKAGRKISELAAMVLKEMDKN